MKFKVQGSRGRIYMIPRIDNASLVKIRRISFLNFVFKRRELTLVRIKFRVIRQWFFQQTRDFREIKRVEYSIWKGPVLNNILI